MMNNLFFSFRINPFHRFASASVIATALLTGTFAIGGVNKALAQTPTRSSPSQNVSIDEVGRNPTAYLNQRVTIRSEVNRTSNPYFFLLDDEDGLNLFGLDLSGIGIDLPIVDVSDDKLLVFDPSGVSNLPDEDGEVLVTGVIRPFVRAEVERQYGVALDSRFYAEYESEPVLFAQSVAYAPDPGDVTADPEGFYGQVIAVSGNVENIYSPYVFSLNDQDLFDGQDLLVLNATPEQLPQRNENVVVVGEVRSLTASEMQQNYGLGGNSNVPNDRMADYTQRPVLIVREIYPAAD
jgi:hypothetical protein